MTEPEQDGVHAAGYISDGPSDYRDYENGVADVLAFLLGDRADVERDVLIEGKLSGVKRQVDSRLTGCVFGDQGGETIVVDCKRWGAKVDVADVGSFIDLVRDVGGSGGLLITTNGASAGAFRRASAEKHHQIEVMSLDELMAWRPVGTVTISFRVSEGDLAEATRALRRVGLRVVRATGWPTVDGTVVIEAFRHLGSRHPDGDIQREQIDNANLALQHGDIDFTQVANGVTAAGGTPVHRWMEVTMDGAKVGLKVLVGSEDDVERELDTVAEHAGLCTQERERLDVARPPGWPPTQFALPEPE